MKLNQYRRRLWCEIDQQQISDYDDSMRDVVALKDEIYALEAKI